LNLTGDWLDRARKRRSGRTIQPRGCSRIPVEQCPVIRFEKRGRECATRGEAKEFTLWSRSESKKSAAL
jgi:hypothetical protein